MALDETFKHRDLIAKVSSRTMPSLERVPGKQNWVDRAGGLPDYIERIAKHLHYGQGMSIGRAIATAVSQCKKWAAGGEGVEPDTRAKAAKAIAEWEAKKVKGRVAKSKVIRHVRDVEFWNLPYGTPLTGQHLAAKRKEGHSDRDIFNATRPSNSKRRLKSQPSTREAPAAPKKDAMAELFGGVDDKKTGKKTGKKSSTAGKTVDEIVADAEKRAKARVAEGKAKAKAEKPAPKAEEKAPEPEPKPAKGSKKSTLTDEDKEMLAVMRDMDDNSNERWELEIKATSDLTKLRAMGGKIDSGRYGEDKAPLLAALKARMAALKG